MAATDDTVYLAREDGRGLRWLVTFRVTLIPKGQLLKVQTSKLTAIPWKVSMGGPTGALEREPLTPRSEFHHLAPLARLGTGTVGERVFRVPTYMSMAGPLEVGFWGGRSLSFTKS